MAILQINTLIQDTFHLSHEQWKAKSFILSFYFLLSPPSMKEKPDQSKQASRIPLLTSDALLVDLYVQAASQSKKRPLFALYAP